MRGDVLNQDNDERRCGRCISVMRRREKCATKSFGVLRHAKSLDFFTTEFTAPFEKSMFSLIVKIASHAATARHC